MQKRRLLLATTALTTMAFVGCRKELPVHGNPKGSMYDAGAALPPPDASPTADASPPADASRTGDLPPLIDPHPSTRAAPPPPANPKGSHYDAGLRPKTVKD